MMPVMSLIDPHPARVLVVGAAIVAADRVLAGERAAPPRLAGQWELPGGKVEAGESDREALVRECREELGVDIAVGEQVGADLPIGDGTATLRVFAARLAAGTPQPLEHADLRWLAEHELDSVRWLPTNLPLLPALRSLLAQRRRG